MESKQKWLQWWNAWWSAPPPWTDVSPFSLRTNHRSLAAYSAVWPVCRILSTVSNWSCTSLFHMPVYLLAWSGVSASVGELSTHVSGTMRLQMYWHWILFFPVSIEQLLTFCQYYSQAHGFLPLFQHTFQLIHNLTIDGTIYPSQHFPFGTAFVCQAENFWTLLRRFAFLQPHFLVRYIIPKTKTDLFKTCFHGRKDKEASDSRRGFKPGVFQLPFWYIMFRETELLK
jgi:hypothetical protein